MVPTGPMFPEYELAPRLEQLPYLLHDTSWVLYSTEYLNGEHGVQATLCDPFFSEDIAVLNTAGYKRVLVLETIIF